MKKCQKLDTSIHIREQFNCEEESLVKYIKQQANQDIKNKISACYVTTDESNNIIGYYTISMESLGREDLPEKLKKDIRYQSIPVVLLGRLARDISHKGTGLGEHLLMDAFETIKGISEKIGFVAIVVDLINDNAKKFYAKYDFVQLDSGRMFLHINYLQFI